MAKAAAKQKPNLPDPFEDEARETPPARSLEAMEHADGKCVGPQIIEVPRCAHCGSDRVKIVSSQGMPVNGKRWQRQRYRCDNAKCAGHTSLSVVMRGPFGLSVAGDKAEAAKVNVADHRKPKAGPRSQIAFAGG